MVRWINQPNWRYEKQFIQIFLMTEKELKELEKFAKENGYNDELKDLYLREVIDQNKEYEWDQIFDQILGLAINILLVIGTFAIALKIAPIAMVYQEKNLCIKYLKHQIDRDKLIKKLKIVKQANPSSICDSILKS